jgi:hypothetical protein
MNIVRMIVMIVLVGCTSEMCLAVPDQRISPQAPAAVGITAEGDSVPSSDSAPVAAEPTPDSLRPAAVAQTPAPVVPHQTSLWDTYSRIGIWCSAGLGPDRNGLLDANVRIGHLVITAQGHSHYGDLSLFSKPSDTWSGYGLLVGFAAIGGSCYGSIAIGPSLYTVKTWAEIPEPYSYDNWFDMGPSYQERTQQSTAVTIRAQVMLTTSWCGLGFSPMIIAGSGFSSAAVFLSLSLGQFR